MFLWHSKPTYIYIQSYNIVAQHSTLMLTVVYAVYNLLLTSVLSQKVFADKRKGKSLRYCHASDFRQSWLCAHYKLNYASLCLPFLRSVENLWDRIPICYKAVQHNAPFIDWTATIHLIWKFKSLVNVVMSEFLQCFQQLTSQKKLAKFTHSTVILLWRNTVVLGRQAEWHW